MFFLPKTLTSIPNFPPSFLQIVLDNSYPPRTRIGVIEFDTHTRFFGITKNKTPEGLGLVIGRKEVVIGLFNKGRLNGQGRRLFLGDHYFKGSFVEGEYHGKGTIF